MSANGKIIYGGEAFEQNVDPTPNTGVGDIRYFLNEPADPRWLKCDGAPKKRSDYAVYEQYRPNAALVLSATPSVFEVPPEQNAWESRPRFYFNTIAGSCIIITDWGGNIYRRDISGNISQLTLTTTNVDYPDFYANIVHQFETGRILLIGGSLPYYYYSDDDGVTWIEVPDALAGGFFPYTIADILTGEHLTTGDFLAIPVAGTKTIAYTDDGLNWILDDLTEQIDGSFDYIPQVTGDSPYNTTRYYTNASFEYVVLNGYTSNGEVYEFLVSAFTTDTGGYSESSYPTTVEFNLYPEENQNIFYECWSNGPPRAYGPRNPLVWIGGAYPSEPTFIGGRAFFIKSGNSNDGAVLSLGIMSPDDSTVEDIPLSVLLGNTDIRTDVFMISRSRNKAHSGPSSAYTVVLSTSGVEGDEILIDFTFRFDPTKFNAPGLAPIAGAHPYVWTGE